MSFKSVFYSCESCAERDRVSLCPQAGVCSLHHMFSTGDISALWWGGVLHVSHEDADKLPISACCERLLSGALSVALEAKLRGLKLADRTRPFSSNPECDNAQPFLFSYINTELRLSACFLYDLLQLLNPSVKTRLFPFYRPTRIIFWLISLNV